MKILADATLPLLSLLEKSFNLTLYHQQEDVAALITHHDILLCRSTLKVTEALLANSSIQCVATASSGTDHIDINYLREEKITLFDAKGCNARAVADYVVATLAYLSKANPGRFLGKTAAVIGVGAVGSQVLARLNALNFKTIGIDPLKAATIESFGTLSDLPECDVICVHANLHDTYPFPSLNLLNEDVLSQLKPGVIIINAARGGIVNEEALLKKSSSIIYCTDVYQNEPYINPAIVEYASLCTPHVAGHSIEAKNNAIIQITQRLYLQYGLTLPRDFHSMISCYNSSESLFPQESWEESVLNLYSPLMETVFLKQAANKHSAFLMRRAAHQYRHDFCYYNLDYLQHNHRLILGGI